MGKTAKHPHQQGYIQRSTLRAMRRRSAALQSTIGLPSIQRCAGDLQTIFCAQFTLPRHARAIPRPKASRAGCLPAQVPLHPDPIQGRAHIRWLVGSDDVPYLAYLESLLLGFDAPLMLQTHPEPVGLPEVLEHEVVAVRHGADARIRRGVRQLVPRADREVIPQEKPPRRMLHAFAHAHQVLQDLVVGPRARAHDHTPGRDQKIQPRHDVAHPLDHGVDLDRRLRLVGHQLQKIRLEVPQLVQNLHVHLVVELGRQGPGAQLLQHIHRFFQNSVDISVVARLPQVEPAVAHVLERLIAQRGLLGVVGVSGTHGRGGARERKWTTEEAEQDRV
eukprot:scaffold1883_cov261-Pinguiococcus_pyrenoidosus.AAC.15